MAALQFNDLLKMLPGTTTPRWSVLVSKIKNKQPLSLNSTGKDIIIDYLDDTLKLLFEEGNIPEIQKQYRGKKLFKSKHVK